MKIIQSDNFDRDTIDDKLVAENITNTEMGNIMVDALNDRYSGDGAPHFYTLVDDDYKLKVWEP